MSQKKSFDEVDNRTFAEKHPLINAMVGIAIIVMMCALGLEVIKIVFHVATNEILKLTEITSKLDVVVIVALITGLISIVGTIISSVIAKIVDYRKSRQEYLTQKREKPYGEFVEMVYKIQQSTKNSQAYPEEQMINDLSKFSKQITLWGSPRVINKWIQFRENSDNPEKAKDNLLLLEDIMNDMRKDLGVKKVKKGNLLGFFINDIKTAIKKK